MATGVNPVNHGNSPPVASEGTPVPLSASAPGTAFLNWRMVYLDGLQGENPDETIYATPEGNQFSKSLLKVAVPSGYFVPLIHGEAIAVMQLTKFTASAMKAQAADCLEAVSIQLGAAVQKIANCQ